MSAGAMFPTIFIYTNPKTKHQKKKIIKMKNNQLTRKQIMKKLRDKAIEHGAMGSEIVSITLNKEEVNITILYDAIYYEFDEDHIILSCVAEFVY